jgi:hypothetical protein
MASGPYGLLLSNVDVGYGSRFWGPQVLTTTDVASFMTAWNVKSQVKVSWHRVSNVVSSSLQSIAGVAASTWGAQPAVWAPYLNPTGPPTIT